MQKEFTKIAKVEKEIKIETEVVAKLKIVKSGNNIERTTRQIFDDKHAQPAYVTDKIVFNYNTYLLAFPLRCKLEKEDDYYLIESEMLDIVGTGKTIDDAEKNFSEEFHFIYTRYNQLTDEMLSSRIKQIKTILNTLVLKIEE